jgi:hypothetical protein
VSPCHPLGCHRRRIPDRVVFEHVIATLVHGSGYERIASPGCSDRTIRRRVHAWANAGLTATLHTLVLEQYDHPIGLDLATVVMDGCLTKAPGGGEKAGTSSVDRGKQGLKRSLVTDATGVPLHLVSAGANVHDTHRLRPTLEGLAAGGPLSRTCQSPWIAATTAAGPAPRWPPWAWSGGSLTSRPVAPSRSPRGGSWSGPMPG